jgi:threonine/homoserine/homoserine lactone efflux protein
VDDDDRVGGPRQAFVLGAGVLAVGVKYWVFTLGAIAAIAEADIGRARSVTTFVVFALLAVSTSLLAVVAAVAFPHRSKALLDGVAAWLGRRNRAILIGFGLVFGTWFLLKGLAGLGIV